MIYGLGCTWLHWAPNSSCKGLRLAEMDWTGLYWAALACTEGGYGGDGDDGGDGGDVTGVSKEGEDDTIAGQKTNKQQGDVLFSQ